MAQDAEDEEEQGRVKAQAQALLDCLADLTAHGSLASAAAMLQGGAQLQRLGSGLSSAGSAEGWRVSGALPPSDGGSDAGGGTQHSILLRPCSLAALIPPFHWHVR